MKFHRSGGKNSMDKLACLGDGAAAHQCATPNTSLSTRLHTSPLDGRDPKNRQGRGKELETPDQIGA